MKPVAGNKIVSTANGDIDIEPNGTGRVILGNYVFNTDQTVAAGNNQDVLTYDDASGEIRLQAGGGTGDFLADGTVAMTGELDLGANSIGGTAQSITGDGTTNIDFRAGNFINFTFGAQNETWTFTDPTNAGMFTIRIKQDGTGSRTITWPQFIAKAPYWSGGATPTLSTIANSFHIITLYYDGTDYFEVSLISNPSQEA